MMLPGRNILLTLTLCLPAALAAGGDVQRMQVSHAHQVGAEPVRVRAYLDLLDRDAQPVEQVDASGLRATLGQESLALESLEPFRGSGEGVAYIFMVDVSRSLSAAQFGEIRGALEAWIGGLRPRDRSAVLSFGETSRLVVDFTASRGELRDGLEGLGPTDGLTLLYGALDEALALAQRYDPDLPDRRAVVLLTDGRDEGSGLTLEDVLERLEREPVPIYTVGLSQLREPERENCLDVLRRIAGRSGGDFFEAGGGRVAAAYEEIRQEVDRVWTADFACPACRADGDRYRLQMTLSAAGRVLTTGVDLRLLPAASLPQPAASGNGPAVAPPSVGRGGAPPATPRGLGTAAGNHTGSGGESGGAVRRASAWWTSPWALAGTLALLCLVGAAFIRRLPRRGAGSGTAASSPPPAREPRPVYPRKLRFVVVRGSRRGREYKTVLRERAVVGKRSTCDCVLAEEENVAPEQFELVQESHQIFVANLAEANPTKVAGLPIAERKLLKSGDLVGNSDVILRLIVEP